MSLGSEDRPSEYISINAVVVAELNTAIDYSSVTAVDIPDVIANDAITAIFATKPTTDDISAAKLLVQPTKPIPTTT